ncbi:hypothetical protein D3C78_1528670 [compost metagenome]
MTNGVFDGQALLHWRSFEHEYLADEVFIHAAGAAGNVFERKVIEIGTLQASVVDDHVFSGSIHPFDHRRGADDVLDDTFVEQLDDVLL